MPITSRTSSPSNRGVALVTLWSVIALIIGGFAAAAYYAQSRPVDAYALCQKSALQASATTTILIDVTDALNDDQKRRLKAAVETERMALPIGGRLVVLSVNPVSPWEPAEHVAVCNPGRADGSNPLLETRSRIEGRWRVSFGDPIDKAIETAIAQSGAEQSPIIITLAATLARADFDARASNRRLIIFSDLLEHDKGGYSQLRGGDFAGLYQSSQLPRIARLDLSGVRVAIDYLQRGKFAAIQGPRHMAFWQRLLREAGAAEVSFIGMAAPPEEPLRKDSASSSRRP